MPTVNLAWTASASTDVTNYRVYRQLGAGAKAPLITIGNVLAYSDATVPNVSQTVAYDLTAIDAAGNESVHSNAAAVTVDVTPPQAPTGLTAVLA
jgi:fibronectin type 3 domain-containing protein